jgi:hypothetical protein
MMVKSDCGFGDIGGAVGMSAGPVVWVVERKEGPWTDADP